MPRVKAPSLSLAASGSLGDALTYRRYKRTNIAQAIPTHPDARSPAQLAQRELYSHARDYWLTLTPQERHDYLTQARPSRCTGLNLCLKRFLKDRLYLRAWWPLNDGASATAVDFSTYLTDAAIHGPIPTPDFCGQADNALLFDGLDDYLEADAQQLAWTSQDFSFTFRMRLDDATAVSKVIDKGVFMTDGYGLWAGALRYLWFRTWQPAADQITISTAGTLQDDTWYTIGITRDGTSVRIYVNGADDTDVQGAHQDPTTNARPFILGIAQDHLTHPLAGRLCDFKAWETALTPAQHLAIHHRFCVHPKR